MSHHHALGGTRLAICSVPLHLAFADKQAIAEALHAEATGDTLAYDPGYNIAPTTTQSILRQQRDTFVRELVPMRWSLVGFGSHGIDPKRSTFNARAEGLEHSSLWRRPLHRQRCIVPMNGYYEWRKADKQAFRFTLSAQSIFGVAGLWRRLAISQWCVASELFHRHHRLQPHCRIRP